MGLSEADTRAKLIDPALNARGWTGNLIRREKSAGAIVVTGQTKEAIQRPGGHTLRE
jgi:type I site-specific restriction endonuclease